MLWLVDCVTTSNASGVGVSRKHDSPSTIPKENKLTWSMPYMIEQKKKKKRRMRSSVSIGVVVHDWGGGGGGGGYLYLWEWFHSRAAGFRVAVTKRWYVGLCSWWRPENAPGVPSLSCVSHCQSQTWTTKTCNNLKQQHNPQQQCKLKS